MSPRITLDSPIKTVMEHFDLERISMGHDSVNCSIIYGFNSSIFTSDYNLYDAIIAKQGFTFVLQQLLSSNSR